MNAHVSVNDEYEELLSYDQVLQYITSHENDNGEIIWKFRRITAHEGPLKPHDLILPTMAPSTTS